MTPTSRPAADQAIASVEEQFAIMFTRVKANMRKRAIRVHPELQTGGYVLLNTLVHSGRAHAGALAEILDMDKSAISRQVRLLSQLGLIQREADPADGRATYLAATPAAIQKVTEVRLADQSHLHSRLRDWEIADLQKLSELLVKINDVVAP
ncbi:MAG: MarR family transcriptional regulator [Microbacteriaceae bacterium]